MQQSGAINGAAWEKKYPGYVDTVETTPGNKTTIFEAPEYGVAVWWELLRRYAAEGAKTVGEIINTYGGGQDYSAYIGFVTRKTGYTAKKSVALDDDEVLLAFGKAMFHYEAGRATPLKDEQILYGLKVGRAKGKEDTAGQPPAVIVTENRTPYRGAGARGAAGSGSCSGTSRSIPARACKPSRVRSSTAAISIRPPTAGSVRSASGRSPSSVSVPGVPFKGQITNKLKTALLQAQPLPLVPGNDLAGMIVRAM